MKTPQYGLFLGGDRVQVTFERSQTIASSKTQGLFTMPAGVYKFLVEIPLSGALYDTLTGPIHEYHAYRVEVLMERWMWPNLVISQPLRVHRCPMPNIGPRIATRSSSNCDLGYHFSVPDVLVPHGSTFPVECWFKLSEGMVVSSIPVRMIERHELCFTATAAEAVTYHTNFVTSNIQHVIVEEKYSCDECLTLPEELGAQQISIPVRLPVGESACSQSYTSRNIKIETAKAIYLTGSTSLKLMRTNLPPLMNGINRTE
ncbi:hypothetical protein BDW66DRAFT_163254 [Aspergillus desertorum]